MFLRKAKAAFLFFLISFSILFTALPSEFVLAEDGSTDAILGALLKEDYNVSYKAEEVVIFFSEAGPPNIHRYNIGVLKPYKMRRDRYGMDGKVKEVIVHDDKMQIVSYPDKKMVVRSPLEKGGDEEIAGDIISLVKSNYHAKIEGEARIAGREALAVSVMPKKAGTRPGFKVWLDHETAIPLKTETYSIKGKLSYQSTISNLLINPSFHRNYFVIMVPPGTTAFETPVSAVKKNGHYMSKEEKVSPQKIAGGYVLKEIVKDDEGYFQAIYHDGLNSISVFNEYWGNDKTVMMEKLLGDDSGGMVERVNLNGFEGFFCSRGDKNLMSFISQGHKITVVGEVSKEGLVEISVELKKRGVKR